MKIKKKIKVLNEQWKSSRRYKFLMDNENQEEDISS
jgi:hypothetical protein